MKEYVSPLHKFSQGRCQDINIRAINRTIQKMDCETDCKLSLKKGIDQCHFFEPPHILRPKKMLVALIPKDLLLITLKNYSSRYK